MIYTVCCKSSSTISRIHKLPMVA